MLLFPIAPSQNKIFFLIVKKEKISASPVFN
nr:MAG TPA: hypothetical protein [Caudoviricetes sp.]